jgi:hypothetical protein
MTTRRGFLQALVAAFTVTKVPALAAELPEEIPAVVKMTTVETTYGASIIRSVSLSAAQWDYVDITSIHDESKKWAVVNRQAILGVEIYYDPETTPQIGALLDKDWFVEHGMPPGYAEHWPEGMTFRVTGLHTPIVIDEPIVTTLECVEVADGE